MSTKIYNAYKFNGKGNELLDYVRSYQSKWLDFQTERILSNSPPQSVDPISSHECRSYLSLYDLIKGQSTKQFPSWGDIYDVRGSIAVYFHKRNIYVQTFLCCVGNTPQFIDARFEDFHYQNQVDPWYDYEELSGEERKKAVRNWRQRRKVWDDIFSDGFSSPSKAGFIYEMCGEDDYCKIALSVYQTIQKSTKTKSDE